MRASKTWAASHNLRELSLYRTRVTDEGLPYLRSLPNLQKLTLEGGTITDRGLTYLKGLPNLHELDLFQTHVTAAGAQELQRSLPKLMIVR